MAHGNWCTGTCVHLLPDTVNKLQTYPDHLSASVELDNKMLSWQQMLLPTSRYVSETVPGTWHVTSISDFLPLIGLF